jgi:hypothetical protein
MLMVDIEENKLCSGGSTGKNKKCGKGSKAYYGGRRDIGKEMA